MSRDTKIILLMLIILAFGVSYNLQETREENRAFASVLCAFSDGVAEINHNTVMFQRIADNNFTVGCVNGEQHYVED